ncbi:retinoid-inducible serine carboxypeptidase-like [Bolinopsis microptera]|uniref:retinoid-inducible serine carboxypeptidase-like n=1 Tax=Bolinopsis microptera TaxID=2820187 RepID=UPI00307A23FA
MIRRGLLGLVLLGLVYSDCVIPAELQEAWGYVDVRPKAHMFWWFMKTPCGDVDNRPIVIWLQGGPGGSGTGYGNFMEVGPLDNNLQPRNYTWLKEASLLFIDSPVGAGFSYVDEEDAFTTTVYEVADDLVTALGEISTMLRAKHYNGSSLPPIFIFSESYGGKVAPVFGSKIVEAQSKGFLSDVELGGVAIGDGAVSLVDSAAMYPDYLFQMSQLDYRQYKTMKMMAMDMELAYMSGDYNSSSNYLGVIMEMIQNVTDDVFFYNIIYHHQPAPSLKRVVGPNWEAIQNLKHLQNYEMMTKSEKKNFVKSFKSSSYPMKRLTIDYNGENVKKLMNEKMREKFGIIPKEIKWGAQGVACHSYLADEMIIDVIDSVDDCLANGVRVIVYNRMLDLIINSAGQDKWINKLTWPSLEDYYQQERIPLYPPSLAKEQRTGAFHKAYKNFEYYWVLMSGHMVPIDAPEMSLEMVRRILSNEHN